MLRYIIRRVLWAILVLLIVVFITYMIFFLLPSGDPAVRLAGKAPDARDPRADPRADRAGPPVVHPVPAAS